MRKRVLSIVLTAGLIVTTLTGCMQETGGNQTGNSNGSSSDSGSSSADSEDKTIKIAVLPKMKGENYWDACSDGARDAIDELKAAGHNVELIYDGPPQDQATNQKQVDIIEGWIAQGVDVIVTGLIDGAAIAPTLKKAMDNGIKIVTFDTDSEPGARDLFINQASYEGIGTALLINAARELREKGYGPENPVNLAIMGQTKTDINIEAWRENIEAMIATDEYSWIRINNHDTDIYYPGADEVEVQTQAATLIARMGEGPDKIQCALGITSMTAPALGAQYSSATSKPSADKIVLGGLATPNALKSYLLDDELPLDFGILWNCMDLGYLAVMAGYQLVTGEVTADADVITTSRLGECNITDNEILLGDPLVITAENVEQFDY